MRTFDPELAMKVAKRIRNIEPAASVLLEAAIEELAQAEMERVDMEVHSLSKDLMREYNARPKR